jgi:antitoxin (DNA-binding transcriptional repressor) of toxin-antitoxin stability system
VKTVEIEDATAPLAAYVREIRKGSVVVLKRGKAMAAVVPLDADEWEDFVVSQDPGFIEVIRRSNERYRAEGGIPFEEICRKHGYTPRPARRSRKAR